MQRSTHQLVTPTLLIGAALSLLLATLVSSGFFASLWETPPHSFGVPPAPPEPGSGLAADEETSDEAMGNELVQGSTDSEPGGAPSAEAGTAVPEDPTPQNAGPAEEPSVEASAPTAPGVAPDPLAELVPTSELNQAPPSDTPQEPAAARVVPVSPVADPAPEGECAFRANDIELGRAVRRRRVARVEQPFVSDGQPVFAWADLHNRDEAITVARVRWAHVATGHSMESDIEMRVGNHWQVIVEQRLPATLLGQWRVDVVDPADCVVMSRQFEMTAIGWQLED